MLTSSGNPGLEKFGSYPNIKGWIHTLSFFSDKVMNEWPEIHDETSKAEKKKAKPAKAELVPNMEKADEDADDMFGDDDDLFAEDDGEVRVWRCCNTGKA